MKRIKKKQIVKGRRARRIRAKIKGALVLPRLSVFRSNRNIYVQLIDDVKGKTLASASFFEVKDMEDNKEMTSRVRKAFALGKLIADKAKKAGIERIVFDRGRYNYHGRVKAVAEGARKGGLIF